MTSRKLGLGRWEHYWTLERVVEAVSLFAAANGRPPKACEWKQAGPDHPAQATVARKFGWNRAISAAGLEPRLATNPTYWTRERIIATCEAFVAEHGRPPYYIEWQRATPGTPSASIVQRHLGTWNAMLILAGCEPRKAARSPGWTQDEVAALLLDELLRTGRWPIRSGWERAPEPRGSRPNARTVVKLFGSWNAAKRYAGWQPQGVYVEPRCSGCGTELDNFTTDCHSCRERLRSRTRGPAVLPSAGTDDPRVSRATIGGATPTSLRAQRSVA